MPSYHLQMTDLLSSYVQMLQSLSEDLARAVMQASPFSLEHHMSVLPSDLRSIAVHAALPAVLSAGVLDLDIGTVSTTTASTVLHEVFSKLCTRYFSLYKLSSVPLISTAAETFHSAVGCILRDCNMRTASFHLEVATPGALESLSSFLGALEHPCSCQRGLGDAEGNTNLKALHLVHPAPHWRSDVQSLDVQSLFKLVHVVSDAMGGRSLHSIRELALCWGMGRFDLDDFSQKTMSSAIKAHPMLTALHLDCGMGNTAVLADMIRQLPHLRKLSLSLYLRAAKKRHARTDREPFIEALGSLSGLSGLQLIVSYTESGSFPLRVTQPLVLLTKMQHLDLGGMIIHPKDVPDLSRALSRMLQLQSLSLYVDAVDMEIVGVLAAVAGAAASNCTSLHLRAARNLLEILTLPEGHLDRVPARPSDDVLSYIAQAAVQLPACLAQLPALQNLYLHNSTLADRHVFRKLWDCEEHSDSSSSRRALLKSVLERAGVQRAAVQAAEGGMQKSLPDFMGAVHLGRLSALTQLRLGASSMLHGELVSPLLHPWSMFSSIAVPHLSMLQILLLDGYPLRSAASAAEWLGKLQVCQLSLSSQPSTPSDQRAPFLTSTVCALQHFAQLSTLTFLELKLGSDVVEGALAGVGNLCSLQHLAVPSTLLTAPTATALASSLSRMRELTIFDIHGSKCFEQDSVAMRALSEGLSTLSCLVQLNLSDCLLECGVADISRALPCMHGIRTICLNECEFGQPESARLILRSLHSLRHLQCVEFRGQDCGTETWGAVQQLVKAVVSLRRFVVDFVPSEIPKESARQLLEAFSNDDPLRCAL